ncbi:DrmB family protein [Streptomyces cacaoi]|uniref:DrmB family protein n=1 Tax=Streptomyces cacaoi TaxID=1898 RepID=UPI001B80AF0B|nr:DrmB family protein [Streptomyces cacaoi]
MKDVRRKVRRAQTIVPFGVGGIIDLRGESFVAADIQSWSRRSEEVKSPRLARKLGVQSFRSAPVIPAGKAAFASRNGPVYVRFPKWLFCPRCRRMALWRPELEQADKQPACRRCAGGSQLAPMRFIQVCRAGHMADIDWHRWAHSRSENHDQRQCQARRLRFIAMPDSSGLEALRVACLSCHAGRSLAGISQKNVLKRVGLACPGTHPWQSEGDEPEICEETPQAVQRGASNVYFPVTHSAIDIPSPADLPAEEEAAQRVFDHSLWPQFRSSEGSPIAEALRQVISDHCSVPESFVEGLRRRDTDDAVAMPTVVDADDDLSIDEWAALSAPESVTESPTFSVRRSTLGVRSDDAGSLQKLAAKIGSIVVADRVREVRALAGFSRYEPASSDDEDDEGGRVVKVGGASRAKWLPAVETYGEGIFLTVDEDHLSSWENLPAVRERTRRIEENLEASFQKDRLRARSGPVLLPRFVMLHTLAHHFIRQLSYDSGYNAASLRERVYARSHAPGSDHPPQAGVFVYTAAGDAEGTLGGLVRQGRPPHLVETLVRLLESAQWCSQDPLCADSTGRSLANLNRAACHACTLLPETCCEAGNSLLDRTLLIGDGEVPGFFRDVVRAALEESAEAVELP